MSETATIVVERDDRMIHEDMEAIQGSIINPLGKLPEGTFERVQEEIQLTYEKSDLRNGERREVGEVKYEPGKDGDIIEIQVS